MVSIRYPACIEEIEPGAFLVTFADVPEAITQGSTEAEARTNAQEALAVALEAYIEAGRPRPPMRAPRESESEVALNPCAAERLYGPLAGPA